MLYLWWQKDFPSKRFNPLNSAIFFVTSYVLENLKSFDRIFRVKRNELVSVPRGIKKRC